MLPQLSVKGVHRGQRGRYSGKPFPSIDVRGLPDGSIELTFTYNPQHPGRVQMAADDLTMAFVQTKIADLVDALIP